MAAVLRTSDSTLYKCANCSCFFATMEAVIQHNCPENCREKEDTSDAPVTGAPVSDAHVRDRNHATTDKAKNETAVPCLWNRANTLLLIHAYSKHKEKLETGNMRKKQMWDKIEEVLNREGYRFTPDQICGRWKTLMRGYKNTADHNNQSGNDRKQYEYQNELDVLFASDPSVNPDYVLSSSKKTSKRPALDNDQDDPSTSNDTPTAAKKPRSRSNGREVVELFKTYLDDQKKKEETENERRQQMHSEKMTLLKGLVDAISKQ